MSVCTLNNLMCLSYISTIMAKLIFITISYSFFLRAWTIFTVQLMGAEPPILRAQQPREHTILGEPDKNPPSGVWFSATLYNGNIPTQTPYPTGEEHKVGENVGECLSKPIISMTKLFYIWQKLWLWWVRNQRKILWSSSEKKFLLLETTVSSLINDISGLMKLLNAGYVPSIRFGPRYAWYGILI